MSVLGLALLAGCGGGGAGASYDAEKMNDCLRSLDAGYLEPPRDGTFELTYGETQYGRGGFILISVIAEDESAARKQVSDARTKLETRLGPSRVEWQGNDSNVAYVALGPFILRALPTGVTREAVERATKPVAAQMRRDVNRCLDQARV